MENIPKIKDFIIYKTLSIFNFITNNDIAKFGDSANLHYLRTEKILYYVYIILNFLFLITNNKICNFML